MASAAPVPANPSSAPDRSVSDGPTPGDELDGAAVTLVDPGKPPHELLRYVLAAGSSHEFRVAHRLTLFDGDQARGSIEIQAPLSVTTEGAAAEAYSLAVRLGPIQITREGDTDSFDASRGTPRAQSQARLLAHVELNPSGTIQLARVEAQAGPETLLLYETLLSLDVPPSQAVGTGARWVTQQSHQGTARTRTEYELVQVARSRATFRVQRQQLDAEASEALQASGEWTFNRDAWPPTGHDQVSGTLADTAPGARLSVRFTVTRSAEAAVSAR